MNRFPKLRFGFIAMFALSAVAMVAVACGSSNGVAITNDSSLQSEQDGGDQNTSGLAGRPGDITNGSGSFGGGVPTQTASFPTPAPQAPNVPGDPKSEDGDSSSDTGNPSPPQSPLDQQQAQVGSERVIVRNVDMSIEVNDPADTVGQISQLAVQEGGWVVRTQNTEVHRGSIEIRVPANRIESVLSTLRDLASNVTSEVSTSQDFTEEFTDTSARIRTLQDTVNSLRALFDRAIKIEDALTIQKEITRIQSEIESMQARVNFLSQSAAFSLIRLTVLALPQSIDIDAGEDKLAAVNRSVRFRAEFTPPEGIENFRIEWDFGDGTGRQLVTGVAPVDTEGRVISAPVVHTYPDDTDSPYIVKVTVTGTGESGAAEGEDVMVVTVNRVPPIEVFAGEDLVVDAGENVTLKGSFTRPDGVQSLRYTWDFGDGSAPVTVDSEPGVTVAEIKHVYANSRPQSYDVVLTVNGETPSGSTEGVGFVQVRVEEPEGLTTGGFTPGETGRSALRALSSIAAGLGTVAIWLGVLSPLWIAAAVIGYFVVRNQSRIQKRRTTETLAEEGRRNDRPVN